MAAPPPVCAHALPLRNGCAHSNQLAADKTALGDLTAGVALGRLVLHGAAAPLSCRACDSAAAATKTNGGQHLPKSPLDAGLHLCAHCPAMSCSRAHAAAHAATHPDHSLAVVIDFDAVFCFACARFVYDNAIDAALAAGTLAARARIRSWAVPAAHGSDLPERR